MVIHAIDASEPERARRLQAILEADDNTDEQIIEALEILEAAGSIEYARERALELAADARTAIDGVEFDAETTRKLEEFTKFVIERDE